MHKNIEESKVQKNRYYKLFFIRIKNPQSLFCIQRKHFCKIKNSREITVYIFQD